MSEGMSPVQIVIGRNTIDGHPLSARAWGKFQALLVYALADEGEFYRLISGHGIDIKGQVEENATILGSWPDGAEVGLEDLLQGLRAEYEQAVILLIWGELEVIA